MNKSAHQLGKLLASWLFVLGLAAFADSDPVPRIESIFGGKRVLPNHPVHAALLPVFQKLVRAQQRLSPSALPKDPQFLVIESSKPNASFVRSADGKTMVVITTSLITKMALESDETVSEASILRSYQSAAAAIAHEISHSNDPNYKGEEKKQKSQENELRVDAGAISILREAGMDPAAIFHAFGTLRAKNKTRLEMALSPKSSHPQDIMRMVGNGVAVTLDRYQKGVVPQSQIAQAPAPYQQWVKSQMGDNRFVKAATPKELWDRLNKSAKDPDLSSLYYEMHDYGERMGAAFTPEQAAEYGKTMGQVFRKELGFDLSDGLRTHTVPDAPVFRSKAYLDAFFSQVGFKNEIALTNGVPPEVIDTYRSKIPAKIFDRVKSALKNYALQQQSMLEKLRKKDEEDNKLLQEKLARMGQTKTWWQRVSEEVEWNRRSPAEDQKRFLELFKQQLEQAQKANPNKVRSEVVFEVAEAVKRARLAFSNELHTAGDKTDSGSRAEKAAQTTLAEQWDLVAQSGYTEAQKSEFVRDFTKRNPNEFRVRVPEYWEAAPSSAKDVRKLRDMAARYGVPFSVEPYLKPDTDDDYQKYSRYMEHRELGLEEIEQLLKDPQSRTKNLPQVLKLVDRLGPLPHDSYPAREVLDFSARVMKVLVQSGIDANSASEAFKALTRHGTSDALDEQFLKLLKNIPQNNNAERREVALKALEKGLVHSKKLRGELAEAIVQQQKGQRNAFDSQLEVLTRAIPQASDRRDALLEEIAWAAKATDAASVDKIEKLKSYARGQHVGGVNDLSLSADILNELTAAEQMAVFKYLQSPPKDGTTPATIEAAIERLQKWAQGDDVVDRYGMLGESARQRHREKISGQVQNLRGYLYRTATEASENEKLGLYAYLLSSGRAPLLEDPLLHEKFNHEILGISPGSDKDKALLAFWDITPIEEKAAAMGYVLSRKQPGKEFDWADIFQSFGTVGIKGGQLGSIWRLFGDEISAATEHLKDQARPMTVAEVRKAISEQFEPDVASKMQIHEILNCASVKCVVSVSIDGDPNRYALALKRPNADTQIEWNLNRAVEYNRALAARGVRTESKLLDSLVSGLRAQLKEETDLKEESKKLLQAKEFYDRMNAQLAEQRGPWKLSVPGLGPHAPVGDGAILMQQVKGKKWNELSSGEKREVGPIITEAALRGLVQEGIFNPDLHTGNILIDPQTHTIHMLDAGQISQLRTASSLFSGDDRYRLVQMLRAIKEKNVDALVLHGQALAKPGSKVRSMADLKAALSRALNPPASKPANSGEAADQSQKDLLIAITSAFADQGIPIKDQITFTGLKGLMVLLGENYVDIETAKKILARESEKYLLGPGKTRAAVDELRLAKDCGDMIRRLHRMRAAPALAP